MSFQSLSEELKALIFDNFNLEEDWKAKETYAGDRNGRDKWFREYHSSFQCLKNLCLVSKDCRRLSLPLLYSRFHRNESDEKTMLFLRTLLQNRELAVFVKEASLGHWRDRSADEDEIEPRPDEMLFLYHEDLIPPFPAKEEAYHDLCRGVQDAEILVLLNLCSNITSLSIVVGYDGGDYSDVFSFLDRQSLMMECKRPPPVKDQILPKLERLHFEHSDTEYSVGLGRVSPFLGLPQLTYLDGHMATIYGVDLTCAIKKANFTNSVWSSSGIGGFLQACPHLESLKLEAGDACVGDVSSNLGALGRVLRKYGTSLKSLTIDPRLGAFFEDSNYDEDNGEDYDGGEYSRQLGTLKPLINLQSLEIPLESLFKVFYSYGQNRIDNSNDGGEQHEDDYNQITRVYSKRLPPEFIPYLYTKVKPLMPDSLTDLKILENFRHPINRKRKCINYSGSGGDDKMKLHIRRGVGGGCSKSCEASMDTF